MLYPTTLRRRSSIRAAAAIAVALVLGLGLAAPAAAAGKRSDDAGRSEPGTRIGALIAHWLGLGPSSPSGDIGSAPSPSTGPGEGDDGPHMDPDGLTDDDDDGPHMDPDG